MTAVSEVTYSITKMNERRSSLCMKKFEHAGESVGMAYRHLWTKLNNERRTGRSKGEHSAWTLGLKGDADTPHTQLSGATGEMASPRLPIIDDWALSRERGELSAQCWLADVQVRARDRLAEQHATPGVHTLVMDE